MSINSLSRATGPVVASDLIAGWPANEQDDRVFTIAQIRDYLQSALTFTGIRLAQQYAAPSATAFNIAVTIADSWLILTPTGAFAAGTITLPLNPGNGQLFQCNCTQTITTLTVAGNGKTVTGAPTTLAANAFFALQFDTVLNAWFRVG
jgi:hypothetical protein